MDNKAIATSKQPSATLNPRHVPTEQEIAVRAYEIFLGRGGNHGSDLDDWLQAERELTAATEGVSKTRTATA
jgi:Protein of unknown function (DUF2934)